MDKYISKNITEEFFNALTSFAYGYISRIKVSIFSHASEIADDDMLRTLLLEYNRRETKYKERAAMDARNIILYGMTLSDSTFDDCCLNHARSYHNVIEDMLKAKNLFY
mgnify:CR=1 FL=1